MQNIIKKTIDKINIGGSFFEHMFLFQTPQGKSAIGKGIDPKTKTILCLAKIEEEAKGKLYNGSFIEAQIITNEKDFEKEKVRLIEYLERTQTLGGDYYDGKESHSFGKLSTTEWNNMFYKHLDHHLNQFGV